LTSKKSCLHYLEIPYTSIARRCRRVLKHELAEKSNKYTKIDIIIKETKTKIGMQSLTC
jgi:hypothetical protein